MLLKVLVIVIIMAFGMIISRRVNADTQDENSSLQIAYEHDEYTSELRFFNKINDSISRMYQMEVMELFMMKISRFVADKEQLLTQDLVFGLPW